MYLKSYQVEHAKKLMKSLLKNKIAIDLSPLGSGKTYTAVGLATLSCFENILILCPKSVIPKWNLLIQENQLEDKIQVMTLSKFIRLKNLTTIFGDKCLLIVDEFQSLKNNSVQSKKVYSTIDKFNLYFLGISGTPFDKPNQLKRFMQKFELDNNLGSFKYNYTYSMGDLELQQECILKNLYIPVSEQNKEDVACYIEILQVLSGSGGAGELFRILKLLENTKVLQIYYQITAALKSLGKCVVMLNYLSSLDMLEKLLKASDIKVECISGKHTLEQRAQKLDAFQNNTDCRVLIGNLKVLSTGIDLDDKHGNEPRTVWISPNFYTVEMYQATKRFQRMDSKSQALIYFVWYKDNEEEKIVKSMQSKSEFLGTVNQDLNGLLTMDNILNE